MTIGFAKVISRLIDEQNLKTGCYHDVTVENGQVIVRPANPQGILMSNFLIQTLKIISKYRLGVYVSTTDDCKVCLTVY